MGFIHYMDKSELLRHWQLRIHWVQIGHYETGRAFEKRHFWLGVPAVILSTIVGTAVFASLAKFADEESLLWPKIAVGLLSVVAAVLISLQTFLRYAEQAESHKTAGAKYAHLKQRLELLTTIPPDSDDKLKAELLSIEMEWEKVREESPNIPVKIWRRIEKKMTFRSEPADNPVSGK
jgi:hypothetical protein